MASTYTLTTEIEPARPLNWDYRAGRLYVENVDSEMVHLTFEERNRIPKEDVPQILREHFDYEPEEIRPDLFRQLADYLSSTGNYEDFARNLAGSLVDSETVVAKHTRTSDGRVTLPMRVYGDRGVGLVVYLDVDPSRYRPRSSETERELVSTIPEALTTLADELEEDSRSPAGAIRGLMQYLGHADTHAIYRVGKVNQSGAFSAGSSTIDDVEAVVLFIPEDQLDEAPLDTIDENRDLSAMLPRQGVDKYDNVRLTPRFPERLLETASTIVEAVNDQLPEGSKQLTTNMLLNLSLDLLTETPDSFDLSTETDSTLTETGGDLKQRSVYVEPETFLAFDQLLQSRDQEEARTIRLAFAGVLSVLSREFRIKTKVWQAIHDAAADPEEIRSALVETHTLPELFS